MGEGKKDINRERENNENGDSFRRRHHVKGKKSIATWQTNIGRCSLIEKDKNYYDFAVKFKISMFSEEDKGLSVVNNHRLVKYIYLIYTDTHNVI